MDGEGQNRLHSSGQRGCEGACGEHGSVGLGKVPAASIFAGPAIDVDLHADVSVPWSCPAPFDSDLAPTNNNSWSTSLLQVVWEGQ